MKAITTPEPDILKAYKLIQLQKKFKSSEYIYMSFKVVAGKAKCMQIISHQRIWYWKADSNVQRMLRHHGYKGNNISAVVI